MNTSEYISAADQQSFRRLVLDKSFQVPVLVDFWAAWCAPCQMLTPILHKLAQDYGGKFLLVTVNTDEERQLAQEHGIRSLPTVRLFRNGKAVEEFFGVQPEATIRMLLDAYMERASDQARRRAQALRAGGDTSAAIQLLREALTSDPDNDRIHLDLAPLLIEQGDFDEAERVLKSLPSGRQFDADVNKILAQLNFARLAKEAPPTEVLAQRISDDPADCEARYQLSAIKALQGDYEGAMGQLLEILRRDRSFRDDAGRKGLVAIFELLGGEGPLVSRYRGLMSSALY
ncbi:MAG: thioredoxin [Gammaproteobacteria bacterium]